MSTSFISLLSSLIKELKCWWSLTSNIKLVAAESELLADAALLSCRFQLVGKLGSRLRTLDIPGPAGTENLPPIVLLHGFGMGLAFWGRQLAEFRKHRRVIAFDLPGMGSSDPLEIEAKTMNDSEEYFILSLEAWREQMQIRRMVLVGAGFGAYIAAIYALRHHKRVEHLMMLSPSGMEKRSKDQVSSCRRDLLVPQIFTYSDTSDLLA
jgi:pimeloyl-ACP methyl ester carboxylesterase